MKLLIDNALSARLAGVLRERGLDVVHVRELGLAHASDVEILTTAAHAGRVVVSRDADFSALLVHHRLAWPSFVHLRMPRLHDPLAQADLLQGILEQFAEDLGRGAILTVQDGRVRVRGLPV